MIDLHEAGAIAFTDGLKPIWHTDILLKSLQYLQKFNGLLIDHPEDIWLNLFGQMHEGVNSTMLGLKGCRELPKILRSEEILNCWAMPVGGCTSRGYRLAKPWI